jgi:beta-glucosidase
MSMPQEPIEPMPAFPPGFLWGASASAFQTEGAADAEGKGPSGWDAFAAQGRIKDAAPASTSATARTSPCSPDWGRTPSASR